MVFPVNFQYTNIATISQSPTSSSDTVKYWKKSGTQGPLGSHFVQLMNHCFNLNCILRSKKEVGAAVYAAVEPKPPLYTLATGMKLDSRIYSLENADWEKETFFSQSHVLQ